MVGWLVVNAFITASKFLILFEALEQAAEQQGYTIIRKTNIELMREVTEAVSDRPDFVLFWDKDIYVAKWLEGQGLRLFNSAVAIEQCDDKALTHLALRDSGIVMPRTILAPKRFTAPQSHAYAAAAVSAFGYPMVVKECFGSFGQQVYLAHDDASLHVIMERIGTRPFLFQEFVEHSRGRDVRLQVVGNRVVAAMKRVSQNGDFRANVSNGGKMFAFVPPPAFERMALDCVAALGLDFAGVDILFGDNETPMLCEVNSNAHFTNIGQLTGVDVAAAIFQHIGDCL